MNENVDENVGKNGTIILKEIFEEEYPLTPGLKYLAQQFGETLDNQDINLDNINPNTVKVLEFFRKKIRKKAMHALVSEIFSYIKRDNPDIDSIYAYTASVYSLVSLNERNHSDAHEALKILAVQFKK